MQPYFGNGKVKELFLENLAISTKNVVKINIFGGNLLKKYSKIKVIYEVKISVCNKCISKSRIIPKSVILKSEFYCVCQIIGYIIGHKFLYCVQCVRNR